MRCSRRPLRLARRAAHRPGRACSAVRANANAHGPNRETVRILTSLLTGAFAAAAELPPAGARAAGPRPTRPPRRHRREHPSLRLALVDEGEPGYAASLAG